MSNRLTAGLGSASYSSGCWKQLIRYYPVKRDCISIETMSSLLFVLVWQGAWGKFSLQISQPEPVSNLHFARRLGHAEISPVLCMESAFSAKAGALIDYLHEVCEIKCTDLSDGLVQNQCICLVLFPSSQSGAGCNDFGK